LEAILPEPFGELYMYRSQEGWKAAFEQCGAIHRHDYNPKRPHAVFIEDGHSDVVFNGDLVTRSPTLLNEAISDLAQLLINEGLDPESVDRVVGPATGGIVIAHDLARHIGTYQHPPRCLSAFAEKRNYHQRKWMIFRRTPIYETESALSSDDTTTIGGSKERLVEAIRRSGADPLPFLALLFNRSKMTEVAGLKIVALVSQPLPVWTIDECPLCKLGSKPLRVKGKNWKLLTQHYD
jgi:orotate phosphoribosyltransferase